MFEKMYNNSISKVKSDKELIEATKKMMLNELENKKVVKNKKKAVQIMSKQGYKFSPIIHKEYDIAIAYEFSWPMNYVMNSVKAKKKILWHHLEFDNSGLDFRIDKKAMDDADALVFVSEDCKESYNKKHPEHAHKTYFIPNILSSDYVRAKSYEDVQDLYYEA